MVYNQGDLVVVDKWNKAYIVEIHQPTMNCMLNDIYFTVRYLNTNVIQRDVPLQRIQPTILKNPPRECPSASNVTTTTRASPDARNNNTADSSSSALSQTLLRTLFKNLQQAMKDSHGLIIKQPIKTKKLANTNSINSTSNSSTTKKSQNPLYNYLVYHNDRQEKGWLRKVIRNNTKTIKKGSRLTTKEIHLLLLITSIFNGFNYRSGAELERHNHIVQYAFFISDKTSKDLFYKYIDNEFDVKTKVRSDKGQTIFNSHTKRRHTFTAFNVFKKECNINDITLFANERLSHDQLKTKFNALDDVSKQKYIIEASVRLQRSSFLWEELKKLLLDTKGTLSYVAMSAQLNDIVGPSTIRRFLMTKEGYHIRKSRLIPSLSKDNIHKRLEWARKYWVFWKAVKTINKDKCQYVLIHMDEKWFFAVKTRSNCKVLTSIGLHPTNHHVQHRSHIDKMMFICVTAYVLNDNDIERGGKAVTIAMIPVTVEKIAERTTYKRNYYGNEGRFNYQNRDEKYLSRVKGQTYFEPTELTGSTTKPKKKGNLPRMSLYDEYKNKIIPAIQEKLVNVYNKTTDGKTRRVVIVLQEDNAGPHSNKKYNQQMDLLFENEGWVRFNQPPQSPVTNVHDAAIFPMLSKLMSRIQAVLFGGRIIVGEELKSAVEKAYFDERNLVAMSRAFAANHQLASAILHYKGDNNYLKEKGGMTFGIRKTFINDKEGNGVVPIDLAPVDESETFCGKLIQKGLKYKSPNIYDMKEVKLSTQMKVALDRDMDFETLSDFETDFWDYIVNR